MSDETIKNYVARQLTEQEKILHLSIRAQDGKERPYRYFFFRMEKHVRNFLKAGNPRWITVPGLRGVGKTTVLAQLFFKYRKKFGNRVLYISLDEVVQKMNGNLFKVLDAYEFLLGESFHSLKDNVLLLVDEVHFDPNWQDALKILFDKSRRMFIVSTGSSAIAINQTADVARRCLVERMHPLRFSEYIMLSQGVNPERGLGSQIRETLLESDTASELFHGLKKVEQRVRLHWQNIGKNALSQYMQFYSLPSVLVHTDATEIYKILNGMLDKIVRKDLSSMHSFSQPILSKIPSLLYLVASSEIRSMAGFAKDLRDIDEKTLLSVFRVLQDAELLLRIYPYSSSAPKKVRKPSKYLFFAPSLRAALVHLVDPRTILSAHKGKLLEDGVCMHLYNYILDRGLSFGYDDARGGADFIISGRKKIVIEVGWSKGTSNQVVTTMQRIQGDYGLLVTGTPLLKRDGDVVTIPFEFFFLI